MIARGGVGLCRNRHFAITRTRGDAEVGGLQAGNPLRDHDLDIDRLIEVVKPFEGQWDFDLVPLLDGEFFGGTVQFDRVVIDLDRDWGGEDQVIDVPVVCLLLGLLGLLVGLLFLLLGLLLKFLCGL
jgi:hypothetical protein